MALKKPSPEDRTVNLFTGETLEQEKQRILEEELETRDRSGGISEDSPISWHTGEPIHGVRSSVRVAVSSNSVILRRTKLGKSGPEYQDEFRLSHGEYLLLLDAIRKERSDNAARRREK